MTSHSNLQAIEQDLRSTLSRSFLTARYMLGDATRAEALVTAAIEDVEPGCLTSASIRVAVIDRLVQMQVSGPPRSGEGD